VARRRVLHSSFKAIAMYLSELRIFAFNFAPKGWALCNGQTLAISANQALFSLLGTTFGGNGVTTFNLPNLQAQVPMHAGTTGFTLGQSGGEAAHTLLITEMPVHTHVASASGSGPTVNSAANANWASNTSFTPYGSTLNSPLAAGALMNAGGGLPHNNMSPYLALTVCIALSGVYPSRS
jgi:microcystin-dependent protein